MVNESSVFEPLKVCCTWLKTLFDNADFLGSKKNTEINKLRKITCLRKSDNSVDRISVCNVADKLTEHS